MAAAIPSSYLVETFIDDAHTVGYLGLEYPHLGTIEGCRKAINDQLTYVGRGVSRRVYTDGRYAYKVEQNSYRSANVAEYRNMVALRLARFPYVGPYQVWIVDGHRVAVMPYYPLSVDDSPKASRDWRNAAIHRNLVAEFCRDIGWVIDDLGSRNWRATTAGRLRIVDLGEF